MSRQHKNSPTPPPSHRSCTISARTGPAKCSTTSRPPRSASPTCTRGGSPSRLRSATSRSGSSGRFSHPGPLPVILYVHGGGWVLGNAGTHDRLVREMAVGVNAAVAFVEYDRSPEARHPVAIEQAYATARWIAQHGRSAGLDSSRVAVAGDSVGGNMATVLAILAKQRGDLTFVHQSLYYPVTDAGQDTGSYREFADGPYLRAASMAWFWDAYLPETGKRGDITASPLRATTAQLAGLPETFLIVDENAVLRDEGEAYGRKLTKAGVRTTTVRYDGTLHDFMMLNPVRGTAAATGAIEQAIHVLRKALGRP
ncbi:MAG: alpha/beta hydrolase [Streptosporangiaceae bacterium]